MKRVARSGFVRQKQLCGQPARFDLRDVDFQFGRESIDKPLQSGLKANDVSDFDGGHTALDGVEQPAAITLSSAAFFVSTARPLDKTEFGVMRIEDPHQVLVLEHAGAGQPVPKRSGPAIAESERIEQRLYEGWNG